MAILWGSGPLAHSTRSARRAAGFMAKAIACLLVTFIVGLASPAYAVFHLARIVEIFTGTAASPGAQYIVIKPFSDLQSGFSTVRVTVFDASGFPQLDFATFAMNLPTTLTNQKAILVATPDAVDVFGITPDQVASDFLPSSGLICFRKPLVVPDCVAYGSYTGSTAVGGSEAGPPATAAPQGWSLHRDLGGDGLLQALDDTNNSAADFFASGPTPENFAGTATPDLTVTESGPDIDLAWTSTATDYAINKTDDPATVRTSGQIGTTAGTSFIDPNPTEFPSVSYYVVKPVP